MNKHRSGFNQSSSQLTRGSTKKLNVQCDTLGQGCYKEKVFFPFYLRPGKDLTKAITRLCQKAWEENTIPNEWKTNIILPIHKKDNRLDCSNYRAICLSSVVLKVYTRILENRLRHIVEPDLEEEQCAFRPGRQTQDHIFSIRTIIENSIERGRDLV